MTGWLHRYGWSLIGLGAVILSSWLLYREVRGLSLGDVVDSLAAISPRNWALAFAATLAAYFALAWYDRIALQHLQRHASWLFVVLCSFSTYALAHNIGASVLSGAVVRYRAYRTQGLTPAEIGVLVAFCSFTFALGVVLIGGLLLVLRPNILERVSDLPEWVGVSTGFVLLAGVGLYIAGAWLHFRPLNLWGFSIVYPRLPIVWRQIVVAPLEIAGAAAIIYFALPAAGNPGYVVILAIFTTSFSAALLSHAPGGIGVLEIIFVAALPELDPADVLAALIVFRLFYLIIPLAIAIVIVIAFERSQLERGAGRV